MQAKLFEHSLLVKHSGLQFGGVPKNSGKHEHDGELLISLQIAFGPHGEGWHGFTEISIAVGAEIWLTLIWFSEMDMHIYVLEYILRKDLQYIPVDNYKSDYGLLLGIWH